MLLVIDEASLGGGQQHVLLIARHIDRKRFDLAVATEERGPLVDALRKASVTLYPMTLKNRPSVRAIRRMGAIMRDFHPDIVHSHGGTAGFAARTAAWRRGCKLVHTYHGIHYLHEGFARRLILRSVDLVLARITHRIICVARADYDLGLAAGLVDPRKSVVIRNGIEIEPYARAAAERRKRGTAEAAPVVGTIGRLHRQKGHRHLLEASAMLRKEGREFRVNVVGEGDLRPQLEAQLHEEGLEGIVRLQGSRSDVPACLAGFDVFVLPSLWEGLPLALLEAMASGLPVVASSVDGVPEIVTDGVNGLLVPPGDPAALAGALKRLLDDPAERRKLGAAAAATARDRFGVFGMMDSLQRLYEDLTR